MHLGKEASPQLEKGSSHDSQLDTPRESYKDPSKLGFHSISLDWVWEEI
jgi:hypothetical protein